MRKVGVLGFWVLFATTLFSPLGADPGLPESWFNTNRNCTVTKLSDSTIDVSHLLKDKEEDEFLWMQIFSTYSEFVPREEKFNFRFDLDEVSVDEDLQCKIEGGDELMICLGFQYRKAPGVTEEQFFGFNVISKDCEDISLLEEPSSLSISKDALDCCVESAPDCFGNSNVGVVIYPKNEGDEGLLKLVLRNYFDFAQDLDYEEVEIEDVKSGIKRVLSQLDFSKMDVSKIGIEKIDFNKIKVNEDRSNFSGIDEAGLGNLEFDKIDVSKIGLDKFTKTIDKNIAKFIKYVFTFPWQLPDNQLKADTDKAEADRKAQEIDPGK